MTATHNGVVSALQAVGDLFNQAFFLFGRETTTNNVVDLTDAVKAAATGPARADLEKRAELWRARYSQLVRGDEIRALFDPCFQAILADLMTTNEGITDPQAGWSLMFEKYFIDNNYYFASRGITFAATPSSSSGTGGGTVLRLTKDRYGRTMEGVTVPFTTRLRCVASNQDAPGEESFSIGGDLAAVDILQQGTSVTFVPPGLIRGANSDGNFLKNAGFGSGAAAVADPSAITGWEDVTGVYGSARYAIVSTNTYMSSVEEARTGVPLALQFKAGQSNHTIQKQLKGINFYKPYLPSLRVRPGAALSAGTLTVTWGSKSQSWDLTALSGGLGAYTLIYPDLDEDLWGYNFAAGDPYFKIGVSGVTDDTVNIDNVRFREMDFWGGTYWAVEPNATQFEAGANEKIFTFADTLAGSDSVLQRLFFYGYGLYMPAVGTATQVTAAGGRTLTFADANPDTITASSGDFTSDGFEQGQKLTVAGTSSNNGTYTIASVTATVITLIATDTLAAEGPLSATATLDAGPQITD